MPLQIEFNVELKSETYAKKIGRTISYFANPTVQKEGKS